MWGTWVPSLESTCLSRPGPSWRAGGSQSWGAACPLRALGCPGVRPCSRGSINAMNAAAGQLGPRGVAEFRVTLRTSRGSGRRRGRDLGAGPPAPTWVTLIPQGCPCPALGPGRVLETAQAGLPGPEAGLAWVSRGLGWLTAGRPGAQPFWDGQQQWGPPPRVGLEPATAFRGPRPAAPVPDAKVPRPAGNCTLSSPVLATGTTEHWAEAEPSSQCCLGLTSPPQGGPGHILGPCDPPPGR